MPPGADDSGKDSFVSTGHLPDAARVQSLVSPAYERSRSNADGTNATMYPAPARVPDSLFGVCVVRTDGQIWVAGDAATEFTIMSVAKPFVFALVCAELGPAETRRRIGVNATSLGFNSLVPSKGIPSVTCSAAGPSSRSSG